MMLIMKCEPGCACKRHQNSGNFEGTSAPCPPGCTCKRHRLSTVAIGQHFGRWTVLRYGEPKVYASGAKKTVMVRCDCGTERLLLEATLLRGTTESCGCLRREKLLAATTSHGLSRHPLYGKWKTMMQRCYNPNWPQFKDWGGRGITVCERWRNVALFIEDVNRLLGPCPPGMSLDRIDNDGDYEPGNIRWATALTQVHNRRISKSAKDVQR
jgi:hypothetical protein